MLGYFRCATVMREEMSDYGQLDEHLFTCLNLTIRRALSIGCMMALVSCLFYHSGVHWSEEPFVAVNSFTLISALLLNEITTDNDNTDLGGCHRW